MTAIPNLEVRPHPSKHRGLYATSSFTAGEVIHAFDPLVLVPKSDFVKTICTYCLAPNTALKSCTRCHSSFYCDAKCQAADWKHIHKLECKYLAKLHGPWSTQLADKQHQMMRFLPAPVRVLLRCLIKPEVEREMDKLDGHMDDKKRQGGELWSSVELMATGATAYAERERDLIHAMDMLCKIGVNSFSRTQRDGEEVGIFLESTLAMANHSCIPNAGVYFVERKCLLRADRAIQAGDEIEISYADYTWPLPKRKEILAPYFFQCSCQRCREDLNVYQVASQAPDRDDTSLASDTTLRNHPAAREERKIQMARDFTTRAVSMMDETATAGPGMSAADLRARFKGRWELCLPVVEEDMWALEPVGSVLDSLANMFAAEGKFSFALVMACQIAVACDPYRFLSPWHTARMNNLSMVMRLVSNTANPDGMAVEKRAQTRLWSKPPSKKFLDVLDKVHETLRAVDQFSLAQMVCMVILRVNPQKWHGKAEATADATDTLRDLQRVPGREKEQSLMDAWMRDPGAAANRAFYEYAVVKPLNDLARWTMDIIDIELNS